MGLSTLGTSYVLRVKAIFILFYLYPQSRLRTNIFVNLSLQYVQRGRITVCQAFIAYFNHCFYITG